MATSAEMIAQFVAAGTICATCKKLSKECVKKVEKLTGEKVNRDPIACCVCP